MPGAVPVSYGQDGGPTGGAVTPTGAGVMGGDGAGLTGGAGWTGRPVRHRSGRCGDSDWRLGRRARGAGCGSGVLRAGRADGRCGDLTGAVGPSVSTGGADTPAETS